MTSKPKTPQDDPAEYKRFLETAKEVGADESADGFERAFDRVIKTKGPFKATDE